MIGKRLRKIIRQWLLILYIKEKEICPVYISEINWNCENQIILFMIPNEEKNVYIIKRTNIKTSR